MKTKLLLILFILCTGLAYAEEPKQETKEFTIQVVIEKRIQELTNEFGKLQQAIQQVQARIEQIRGAVTELQKLDNPQAEKK